MQIEEILRKIRRDKNLSQQNIADEMGIDISTYARIEKGEVKLRFEHAIKLAQLYKLSLDELYHYGEVKSVPMDPIEMYRREQKRVDVMVRLDGSDSTLDTWVKKLTAINQIL